MDDLVGRPKAKISAAEIERRREADANNRIEGQFSRPGAEAVFDAFIIDAIELDETLPRIDALYRTG
jgi:hypothetical protein